MKMQFVKKYFARRALYHASIQEVLQGTPGRRVNVPVSEELRRLLNEIDLEQKARAKDPRDSVPGRTTF